MARSIDPVSEIWGTWEELLLSCAVNRHGTRNWDLVAMEVKARSSFPDLLNPQSCRQRYRDLRRRFAVGDNGFDRDGDDAADCDSSPEVPWLEELRKLRVAELRREVEQYDVSIGSLQLRVKELKDERERSLQDTTTGEEEPDPKEEGNTDRKSLGSTPETFAGDRVSVGNSARSCKESNSTDPKDDDGKPSGEGEKLEGTPIPDSGMADPVTGGGEKTAGEGSYNGSSDTIAKGTEASPVAEASPAPPQLGESGSSMGRETEGRGEKESSDVQSSASLSRRRRRRRRKAVSGSSSAAEEPEVDEISVSHISKQIAAESQPLVSFLEIIRSTDYGSMFERRLENQESARYRRVIRQHVDLQMVRSKLERGGSAYTSVEFFRDLLLLCNNAIVFYPSSSMESIAAVHVRDLVSKKIPIDTRNPARPPAPAVDEPSSSPSLQLQQAGRNLKLDPDVASSLVQKPTSSVPLIACRKRSSMSGKADASTAMVAGAKDEREEQDMDGEERESEESSLPKSKVKEKSGVSATRGLRSNKIRGGSGKGGGGDGGGALKRHKRSAPNVSPEAAESTAEVAVKADRKSGGGVSTAAVSPAKKQSAAKFLNRMKRSSTSHSKETQPEKVKSSAAGGGVRGAEQKKGVKGNGRKEQNLRHSSAGAIAKKVTEKSTPVKMKAGRTPKRAAPPPKSPPSKRARVDAEAVPRKRPRPPPPPPPQRRRGRR